MNPLRQVAHVVANDVRRERWLLLGYLLIVGYALANAFGLPIPIYPEYKYLTMFVVVAYGMLLAALAVLGDSPTRPDAFWPTRPLGSATVALAKCVFAFGVVIGIPLAAQVVALHVRGVDAANIPSLSASSARAAAQWLVVAMLVAALSWDLRGLFAALFVPIACAVIVIEGLAFHLSVSFGLTSYFVALIVPLCAATALLWYVYRIRRPAKPAIVLAVVVSLAALITTPVPFPHPDIPANAFSDDTIAAPRFTPRLSLEQFRSFDAPFELSIVADAAPSERVLLGGSALIFHFTTGDSLRVPTNESAIALTVGDPRVDSSMRWTDRLYSPSQSANLALDGTSQGILAHNTITRIVLTGTATVWKPYVAASMIPRSRATSASRNYRVGIGEWTTRAHGADAALTVSRIPLFAPIMPNTQSDWSPDGLLVNARRHEVMSFAAEGRDWSQHTDNDGWLVLPSTMLYEVSRRYFTVADNAIDSSWFNDVRLLIIDWTEAGQFSWSAPVDLPTAPARSPGG